ncbi:MAG TPA: NAD(P)-binding domain-containing protein [Gammaproteobacteria bacterium]|nr:NAD(P)-binding domain-containing protein [Gammaproteobacteria bacterium]
MKKIGFIGLGIMGKPMAKNLLNAKFPLYIYTRRPETEKELVEAGAIACSSPKELAAAVDVIITMLPTTHDVDEILFGKMGIQHTATPGCIVIDMSTISASATKKFAQKLSEHQIEMLDAPVSGGEQGAIDGTLSIMVGGKEEVLSKVRKIFSTLGKRIVHIGDHGAGQTAKACNQIIIAETIIAVDEALRLAKKSGVDPAKVREALMGGFASSRVLEVHGKRMLEGDYQPGFKASLHRKDMHLALDEAHHAGVYIPAAKYATQCIDQLVMKGHSNLDSSAIHLLTED